MRHGLKVLAFITLSTFLSSTAGAIPVVYSMTFEVTYGRITDCTAVGSCTQSDADGNHYYGLFAVDDAVLQSDGLNKPADVLYFAIKMEDNIWAYNLPFNNSFEGFYGPSGDPDAPPWESGSMYASSPGFDVQGGEIVNLRGGVFGEKSNPYVDLSRYQRDTYWTPNVFFVSGAPVLPFDEFRWLTGDGSFWVTRIPEPGTLTLLGLGLAGLGLSRRRKA